MAHLVHTREAVTADNSSTRSYTWVVEDFIAILECESTIETPLFALASSSWTVHFERNVDEPVEYVSVLVVLDPRCLRDDTTPVLAKYRIGFGTGDEVADGLQFKYTRQRSDFEVFTRRHLKSVSFKRFIMRSVLIDHRRGFLSPPPTSGLTVTLEMTVMGDGTNVLLTKLTPAAALRTSWRRRLHDAGAMTDLDIVVDGGLLKPAHKIVLATRSAVFRAMFDQEELMATKEKTTKKTTTIQLSDVDGAVVDLMLEYLYTGEVSGLTHPLACRLLTAADRYDLSDLKERCQQLLVKHLTAKNIGESLALCASNSADELRSGAVDFLIRHLRRESVAECVSLAQKYDVQELMDAAVAFLIRSLNGENVSEYLNLTAKYGVEAFKDAVVNFLVQHLDVDNATKYLALAKKHGMVEVKIAAEHLLAPTADIQVNANEN